MVIPLMDLYFWSYPYIPAAGLRPPSLGGYLDRFADGPKIYPHSGTFASWAIIPVHSWFAIAHFAGYWLVRPGRL